MFTHMSPVATGLLILEKLNKLRRVNLTYAT